MKRSLFKDLVKRSKTRTVVMSGLILLLVIVAEIALTCAIPAWRQFFYNMLEGKNLPGFYTALLYFITLMGGLGVVQGLKTWVGQLFSFKLRAIGTKLLFKPWVKGKREASNYAQSMTESLRNTTEGAVEVGVECLISLAIVIVLMVRSYGDWPILVASMVFTIVVSILAAFFNKPLVHSNVEWQLAEGRLRETIGDVANGREDWSFKAKLTNLGVAYAHYSKILMYYTLFSRTKASLSSLVPYLLLSGAYFAGHMTLGVFMDGVATFELIVVNTTILLVLYPKLMQVKASYLLANKFYSEVRHGDIKMPNTKK